MKKWAVKVMGLLCLVSMFVRGMTVLSAGKSTITVNDLPAGQSVRLYLVGQIGDGAQVGALTGVFAESSVRIDVDEPAKRTGTAALLSGYAKTHNVTPLQEKTVQENGSTTFSDLSAGIYLVAADPYHGSQRTYLTSPLVLFAAAGQSVICSAKVTGWDNPDGTRQLSVIKVWDGEEDIEENRPDRIEVLLLKDGETFETFSLSEEENWSHTFADLPDGHDYTFLEEVPEGYMVSMETTGGTTVLTNTWGVDSSESEDEVPGMPSDNETPENPEKPEKPADPVLPQTGQDILLPAALILAGFVLVILGLREGSWEE